LASIELKEITSKIEGMMMRHYTFILVSITTISLATNVHAYTCAQEFQKEIDLLDLEKGSLKKFQLSISIIPEKVAATYKELKGGSALTIVKAISL
jgi:hypothetical protein